MKMQYLIRVRCNIQCQEKRSNVNVCAGDIPKLDLYRLALVVTIMTGCKKKNSKSVYLSSNSDRLDVEK